MDFLITRKYLIAIDPGWNRWDLEVYRGVWTKARVTVAAENHGGNKRLLNVRCEIRLTQVAQLAVFGYVLAVIGGFVLNVPEIRWLGFGLGVLNLGVIVGANAQLVNVLNDSFDIVAERITLRPLGAQAQPPAQAA